MFKCICCVCVSLTVIVIVPIILFLGFYHPLDVQGARQHPKNINITSTPSSIEFSTAGMFEESDDVETTSEIPEDLETITGSIDNHSEFDVVEPEDVKIQKNETTVVDAPRPMKLNKKEDVKMKASPEILEEEEEEEEEVLVKTNRKKKTYDDDEEDN